MRSAKQRRPARRVRAFTLMEILVAMAVLSIALMTIYQSFASTVQINTVTRGLWKAIIYVDGELARIERGPTPAVSIQQGEFPPNDPMAGYAWLREAADEEPMPGVRARKVRLELTWTTGAVPHSYSSQIYVQAR